MFFFFFSSRRRHTRLQGDWSSDVCSSDLEHLALHRQVLATRQQQAGPESVAASDSLTNLASVKLHKGEYSEAENLFTQAREIRATKLAPDHPRVLGALNNEAVML